MDISVKKAELPFLSHVLPVCDRRG